MRLVSLNAWGGKVWPALRDWVADQVPDILCLQEVTRAPAAGPDWLIYRDADRELWQRADLFGDISRCLPRHQAWFSPATRGHLVDTGGGRHVSEHGLALWCRGDLAMTEQSSAFVHGAYRGNGWGPQPVPRTMQMARIHDPDAGAGLVVAHFHGLRDPSGKGDTTARLAQSEAVMRRLEVFRRPGEPTVLAGDFNLTPDTAGFRALLAGGLVDLVTTGGHADTRTTLYPKPVRLADYMLVSPQLRLRAFDVPARPEMSDHRPLVLEFGL